MSVKSGILLIQGFSRIMNLFGKVAELIILLGEDSSSKNKNNIAFRGDECVASTVRVGLSCAADSSKERFPMREA